MRKVGALLVSLAAAFAALAVGQAANAAPTGDTCVANATGTQYTLTVTLPSGAPQQDGFAVGVKGGNVTSLSIGGVDGQASTANLPAGTQQAWLLGSPQGVPGASVVVSVHADTASAKTFTVAPYDQVHQTWFDSFACPVSKLTSAAATTFTVASSFVYQATTRTWGFSVKVPVPGTVSVNQDGGSKQLIAARRIKVKAGTTKLTLVPTAAGRAAAATGALKVKLSIEFSPASGQKPFTRTLSVTLRGA